MSYLSFEGSPWNILSQKLHLRAFSRVSENFCTFEKALFVRTRMEMEEERS